METASVITEMLDHQQVKMLYEQHGRVLLAYAVSLLPDRAASEDVLHYRRNHSREVELERFARLKAGESA